MVVSWDCRAPAARWTSALLIWSQWCKVRERIVYLLLHCAPESLAGSCWRLPVWKTQIAIFKSKSIANRTMIALTGASPQPCVTCDRNNIARATFVPATVSTSQPATSRCPEDEPALINTSSATLRLYIPLTTSTLVFRKKTATKRRGKQIEELLWLVVFWLGTPSSSCAYHASLALAVEGRHGVKGAAKVSRSKGELSHHSRCKEHVARWENKRNRLHKVSISYHGGCTSYQHRYIAP